MNIEDEITNAMASEMQKEIDGEIMRSLLRESGWHEVVLQWIMTHEVGAEVDAWVASNSKEEYWNRGLVWLFKSKRDAVWFSLRWSS